MLLWRMERLMNWQHWSAQKTSTEYTMEAYGNDITTAQVTRPSFPAQDTEVIHIGAVWVWEQD